MAPIFQLAGGLLVMSVGADVLVRYAVKLSLAMRVSPLVVGLTVVAFGTSMPELVVSLQSTLRGQPDIAIGNVVGSNTFNILFILGLSALITPLAVDVKLIRFDVPLVIGLSILLWGLSLDGLVGRGDGLMFVAGLIGFAVWSIAGSRRDSTAATDDEFAREYAEEPATLKRSSVVLWILFVLGALGLLVFGSRLFTGGAIEIARRLGVSELVIGLTLVSAGTSLPEVATSVMAAWKGERDIAVGNVVGSNLFNILGVLGFSAAFAPAGVDVPAELLRLDLPVMIAASVACLPIFFTGHCIDRWEGGLFLAYYVAYTAARVLIATGSTVLESYRLGMVGFVLPLTGITLAIAAFRAWKNQRGLRKE